ncbi:Rpn family recombination-promoting nuclease/putative transposase, partial [Shigella flexneri]|nr:Rpn family recombination-promoting nuclease/putative transposase [Shigella flexneri]
ASKTYQTSTLRADKVVPILFYQGEATPYPLSMCWFDMFYSPELASKTYQTSTLRADKVVPILFYQGEA